MNENESIDSIQSNQSIDSIEWFEWFWVDFQKFRSQCKVRTLKSTSAESSHVVSQRLSFRENATSTQPAVLLHYLLNLCSGFGSVNKFSLLTKKITQTLQTKPVKTKADGFSRGPRSVWQLLHLTLPKNLQTDVSGFRPFNSVTKYLPWCDDDVCCNIRMS